MALREARGTGTPREVFGAIVRFYRERAGLSRAELAGRIHKSVALIQAIELGDRIATPDVTADLEAVEDLNTNGALMMLRQKFGHSLNYQAIPTWFADWASNEQVAVRLRGFEPMVVPGLLQTEGYARALLTGRIGGNADAEEAIRVRLERQGAVTRDVSPAEFLAVIDEWVLRRPVGGPRVMAEQVGHLIEMARRPNVVIQVIPASTGAHDGLDGGAFAIAEFEDGPALGYQDTALQGQVIEDEKAVATLAATWDRLRSEALPRTASVAVLEEAAAAWSQSE